MSAIADRIETAGWSQARAAHLAQVTQPRISDLCRGKLSKFSVDSLLKIGGPLGVGVIVTRSELTAQGQHRPSAVNRRSDR